MPHTSDSPNAHPVTREEFEDFGNRVSSTIDKLGQRVEELFRAKQVSWPLIISVLLLSASAVGFLIKNVSDVNRQGDALDELSTALAKEAFERGLLEGEMRERVRAQEAGLAATITENETQNRWMADIENLRAYHEARELHLVFPETFPPLSAYYPLAKIGGAPANGDGD